MKQLSADTVRRIRDLKRDGLGNRAIAKELGISTASVHRYLCKKPDDPGAPPWTAENDRKVKERPPRDLPTTTNIAEAAIIAISPRRFEFSCSLLWQAMEVTRREWNWPELSPGDWIDTFLYYTMKQRGIILGGYQVVRRPGT